MFNEEQKRRFISDYTDSINTKVTAVHIFNAIEVSERGWRADLCTRTAAELQPVVDSIVGIRSRSRWTTVYILREYVKWCIATGAPGACDGMLHVEPNGIGRVRRQMVASPLHLQRYLDSVFDKESAESIDNIYRCYLWMAYCGVKEKDAVRIKVSEVDLLRGLIQYNDGERDVIVQLYREALPAFQNAATLTSFAYLHPRYTAETRLDRVPGDTIMRGVRASTKTMTIRSTLSKRMSEAADSGRTNQQLSWHRIALSGLFYRVYERERAGFPVSFSEAAVDFLHGKEFMERISKREQRNRLHRAEAEYLEDYERWKLAFSI